MKNKDSEQDEERGVWEKWTLSRSIKDGFQNKEREREREREREHERWNRATFEWWRHKD